MRNVTSLKRAAWAASLIGLAAWNVAQAGSFSSDFSSPPAGATLYGDTGTGDAGVIEDGVLKLTKAVGSQMGGFVIDDLDGGATVYGFTATFKLLIGGGSAADGFSFNFGPDIPDGSMGEEGAGSGLSVSFDVYDNGGGEAPALDIKKGGVIIASTKGVGALIRANAYRDVVINVDSDGTLDLSVGGTVVYTNLLGAFVPSSGRFALGARTGGANDNHFVDDLNITTRLEAPTSPIVKSAVPQGPGVAPDAVVLIELQDMSTQVNQSSVQLKLNGQTVAASVAKAGDVTTVQFDPPGLLPSRSTNTVEVSYADNGTPPKTSTFSYVFVVADVVGIPSSLALPAAAVDTTKPGFLWTIFANSANQANSNDRTEAALAGTLLAADGTLLPNLADPTAQGVARGPATPPDPENATITFEIETVINLNQDALNEQNGNFVPDDQMPGIPATDASTDGIAAEVLTYLELPAGIVTMGVNSDDGFRTTVGNVQDVLGGAIVAGEFNGGRGAADTTFTLLIEQAGFYAFRTIWEEGGGGANIEWFTVKSDGTKVLVNDVANGGVKAYRARKGAFDPVIRALTPTPAPRQANGVSPSVVITLRDGSTPVNDNSITLKVDGQEATLTKRRVRNEVTATWTPPGLQIPSESHTAMLSFQDATGAYSRTAQWTFLNLKSIVLPAPKILEDFESYDEGTQPTGWTALNFTSTCTPGEDIGDQTSDTYKNWVVISRDTVQIVDGDRALNVAPGQIVNGQPVSDLVVGKCLYAESDGRCNSQPDGLASGQTQFIVSKPFDCSQFAGVVVTFHSIYEQNQDSLGAVEYSVDGGRTWLPVVYFLDAPDIKLNADGTVDAVKTFTDANADTSAWVDNGVPKGDIYGDGIAAPITPALGLYVVPRVNDNPIEGKRVEVFRLPHAAGKSDVRLRFAQLGTNSWYFGVDNLAFYDVAPPVQAELRIAAAIQADGRIRLTWQGSATLQSASTVTGPYTDVSGASSGHLVTPSDAQGFYRLKQ